MPRRAFFGIAGGLLLIAGLAGSVNPPPGANLIGIYPWSMEDPLFGGLSALEILADGSAIVVLSDKGTFTTGRILRDPTGRIERIDAAPMQPLQDASGDSLPVWQNDSEGLAIDSNGRSYVSFEGPARILAFPSLTGPAKVLPDAPEFAALANNKALEALAIGPDNAIYTLPEDADGDFPLFRLKNNLWDRPFQIARLGNFLPVGADIGPDGRLYLLERQFHGLSGFASRLRRFDLESEGRTTGEILLQTTAGAHDNLEGLSIWRDAKGRLVASMVSDDNFIPFLAMEIVEYHLPD